MDTSEGVSSRKGDLVVAGITVGLLGVFYLSVWQGTDPKLLYHQQCPVFMTGLDFASQFWARPAGLVEYASLFLAQFYYYPWVGALIITVMTWLICLATRGVLSLMSRTPVHPALCFFPAILLLMLLNSYEYHLISSLALLLALVFANTYVRLPWQRLSARLGAFVVLAAVLYYLAAGMVVLFGLVCGVYELAGRRRVVLGLACVLLAWVPPLVCAAYSFNITLLKALVPLLPWRRGIVDSYSALLTLPQGTRLEFWTVSGWLRWALLGYCPLVMVAVAQQHRLGTLVSKLVRRPAAPEPLSSSSWSFISLGVFLALAAGLVMVSVDEVKRDRILLDYHAQHREWNKVLLKACDIPSHLHDMFVMCEVNRALFHKGRLLSDMFRFPQRIDSDALFMAGARSWGLDPTYLTSSKVFFELGQVNYAQKMTHQALEIYGERPEILKRLIRINVVKDRAPVARRLLSRLRKNLLYRTWADDYLTRLNADPVNASDEEVRRVRALVPAEAYGLPEVLVGKITVDSLLEQLLAANRKNRMAFEYMMAYFLLTKQTGKVVAGLGRFDDYDYPTIPRHVEQAIVVHQGQHPKQTLDLHGWKITEEVLQELRDFSQAYLPYERAKGPERKEAIRDLLTHHAYHYFFYFRFQFSVANTQPFPWDAVTGATR